MFKRNHINLEPLLAPQICKPVGGSGWVCDALQLFFYDIPFISQKNNATIDEVKKKLVALGITPSANGQFPIIITNAHVVQGMKQCSVQVEHDSAILPCKLLHSFSARDLAILIPPEKIKDKLICSEISTEPLQQGRALKVYGFPKNGQGECSLTEGSLSRIITGPYAHSGLETLEYEMSATINGGNSGGPVVVAGKADKEFVIAVAHQHSTTTMNQFHSIPVFHLVAAFRYYLDDGKDVGLLTLPIMFTSLKNPNFRKFYKLEPDNSDGVLIESVSPMYNLPLKAGDILLQIDKFNINSEGKISLFEQGRVNFLSYLHFLPPFSQITCKIIRKGQEQKLTFELHSSAHCVLRDYRLPTDNPPVFYQHGLVFCGEISGHEIIKAYSSENSNRTPLKLYNEINRSQFKCAEQMGTVAFFPLADLLGYQLDEATVIRKIEFDGVEHTIRDIYHLFTILNPKESDAILFKPRKSKNNKISPGNLEINQMVIEKEKDFVALYRTVDAQVPFCVVPKLSKKEEETHRKHYGVSEQFSPESFEKNRMLKTKGWSILQQKYHQGTFFALKKKIEMDTTSEANTNTVEDSIQSYK